MLTDHREAAARDQLTATWIDLATRVAVLGLLLYLTFLLIRPFITIAIWSVVLTVALYPTYERIVRLLGGRRKLASAVLTVLSLLILIGPVAWLVLGLIDSIRSLTEQLDRRPIRAVAARNGEELAACRGDDLSVLGARLD